MPLWDSRTYMFTLTARMVKGKARLDCGTHLTPVGAGIERRPGWVRLKHFICNGQNLPSYQGQAIPSIEAVSAGTYGIKGWSGPCGET